MNKLTKILITFLICLTLGGCEKPQETKSNKELIGELKVLNNLLVIGNTGQNHTIWPFTNDYLEQKNSLLLAMLANTNQKIYINRTVKLLIIEQRFTERFFPWPVKSNPILNYFNSTEDINTFEVVTYLDNVIQTMQQAANDHIKLNRIELAMLKNQVSTAKATADDREILLSLTELELFLNDYTARRSLGLGALPNGEQWYQARLNHFLNGSLAPNTILNRIFAIQTKLKSNRQFVKCYLSDQYKNDQGIDWRSGYSDRLLEFENIKFGLEQAIIAEVDFGVHAQAWTQEHAMTVLTTKLSVNSEVATQILTKIILEPALALVNLPLDDTQP